MIHQSVNPEGGFSISSRGVWLPGIYESERVARVAFFFRDHVLHRLQGEVNVAQKRHITMADLRACKPHGLRKPR